jgi:pyridoxine 5-phosphate synthase
LTKLSVNVNKVAVLRNSRGGHEPDPARAARVALASGCDGITVHPRPDQRHIRGSDVVAISALLDGAELNMEGNPFAAERPGYPGLVELARQTRPAQVTLVPDGDSQLTSDHGFRGDTDLAAMRQLIDVFKTLGARVSLFVDAGCSIIERLAECGADRIEIYTGPYAAAFHRAERNRELDACVLTAERARACGLGVNAGHDLDQENLGVLVAAAPWIAEVSIGHALFAEALYDGLEPTIHKYLEILSDSR